jgi:hypothetical protein
MRVTGVELMLLLTKSLGSKDLVKILLSIAFNFNFQSFSKLILLSSERNYGGRYTNPFSHKILFGVY